MVKPITLAILTLLLTTACLKQAGQPEADTLPSQVQTIAVLPVIATPDSEANPGSPQTVKQMQDGTEVLTQILTDSFAGIDKIRLLSAEEVESLNPGFSANQTTQALFVGKALKAEAVMLWELTRYHERSGSDYAVQTPASLAFEYRLLHTESGQTLCSGSFDETQQSATENLLSLKKIANRGFKWITAPDLAREGVTKKLPDCA